LIDRDGADGIELGLVVGADRPSEISALLEGAADVGSIELRGPVNELGRWRECFTTASIFVEGPPVEAVAELREHDGRIGAKLRCGGLEKAAFPSTEAVASFVEACVRLDVPFKATAGLHQPLRHWDPELGTFHHGFLNILAATGRAAQGAAATASAAQGAAATARAAQGAAAPELVRCLEVGDGESWRDLGFSTGSLAYARRWFTAFGTCSIVEPLEGLAAIGLLRA
jgi:hypothetical protein